MYKHSALETIFTALDTQLNSLANGSACSPSSAIDNTTTGTQRWPAAMVEIYIAAQASAARRVPACRCTSFRRPTARTTAT